MKRPPYKKEKSEPQATEKEERWKVAQWAGREQRLCLSCPLMQEREVSLYWEPQKCHCQCGC